MKREIEAYSLRLGDHLDFVGRRARVENHWRGLGYPNVGGTFDNAAGADGVIVDKSFPSTSEVIADEPKTKR